MGGGKIFGNKDFSRKGTEIACEKNLFKHLLKVKYFSKISVPGVGLKGFSLSANPFTDTVTGVDYL